MTEEFWNYFRKYKGFPSPRGVELHKPMADACYLACDQIVSVPSRG